MNVFIDNTSNFIIFHYTTCALNDIMYTNFTKEDLL
nr:MAG TPA: hypothetical protein [Caudoviricetes sp.]